MNVIYTVTMYEITLSKAEVQLGLKEAVSKADRSRWEKIDHIEFLNMSNARFAFEGRRTLTSFSRINDDEYDVTFFSLSEEQKTEAGKVTRIDVIDIAVPDSLKSGI